MNSRNLFIDGGPGTILHQVQMARLFPDCKTFVDMKLKERPSVVLEAFDILHKEHAGRNVSSEELSKFVAKYFTLEDQMEQYDPLDWKQNPALVGRIIDERYSEFASALNHRWKILCRKIKLDVSVNPDLYTLIYLPNPVVVPGGRFREVYYWDSYWIIRGLLLSEMYETVRGILGNFVSMVERFGLIPNGGRTYYLNRSQPPLFIQMVKEYVDATKDYNFVKENFKSMAKEFDYWMKNHMTSVKLADGSTYELARFNCENDGPRPESYFEDFDLVENQSENLTEEEKRELYWEMKTGAETGWDYSTRWMINEAGTNEGNRLLDTKPRSLIPVDLNAFLVKNAQILAEFSKLCQEESPDYYEKKVESLTEAMDAVLWNEEDGIWYVN